MLGTSQLGVSVSTTHVVSSSVMGVGATCWFSAVRRGGLAGDIVTAWVPTIPGSALVAALAWAILRALLG
jgi:PiT family inorganic phosphate transporter